MCGVCVVRVCCVWCVCEIYVFAWCVLCVLGMFVFVVCVFCVCGVCGFRERCV